VGSEQTADGRHACCGLHKVGIVLRIVRVVRRVVSNTQRVVLFMRKVKKCRIPKKFRPEEQKN
jgi:hypothetical protein